MIKQLIGRADQKGLPANFTWEQINDFMSNMGAEEFDYNTFKLAYDADPVIQALVDRFDQKGVQLATKASKATDARVTGERTSSVSQNAKRATARARNR